MDAGKSVWPSRPLPRHPTAHASHGSILTSNERFFMKGSDGRYYVMSIWKHVFPFGIFLIHEISEPGVSDLEWMRLSFGCLDCDYIRLQFGVHVVGGFPGAETGLGCGLRVSMQSFIPGIILFFLWTFYEVVAIKTMPSPPQVTHVPNNSSSTEQTDFTRNPQDICVVCGSKWPRTTPTQS